MSAPRFFVDRPINPDLIIGLPPGAARHVQVLRLQPGNRVTLFNGLGGQWQAEIIHMGRKEVQTHILAFEPIEREIKNAITWAIGIPTNERMDTLVEKATELGIGCLQPLLTDRSVLRLQNERAQRKVVHWQAIATAACEQCGRNQIPLIAPITTVGQWLISLPEADATQKRFVLSLSDTPIWRPPPSCTDLTFLSGPEGGLTDQEIKLAKERSFDEVSLGPRTLRADTAPLMVIGVLAHASL